MVLSNRIVTFANMSAKLVVQRFETDVNFKYLNVTIGGENDETRFSEWLDGETHSLRKAIDKSSHLVVKIVSGHEYGHFNLDSCAKQVNGMEINNADPISVSGSVQNSYNLNGTIQGDIKSPEFLKMPLSALEEPNSLLNINLNKHFYDQNKTYLNSPQRTVCPLEYSLERVKENNARIMENIHMLNRTLNYTKKRESLDIGCSKPVRSYTCNTCGKCFVYETGLRRHYSTRHAILDIQPRWQVVWTCIECFQVWPRHDVALQHATRCCQADNLDCVRDIKTSSLLQCEFCEKVFTSIPRLLRHAKTHTSTSNYECNACEMAFSSYKTAEQHWLSCPWLKTCYKFHLGKLLLCNACDRKFRNYEQLYNHRYKANHFMTKTHYNQGHNTLGVLVYQCEMCGQWFASVALLLNHRSQYHPRYDTNTVAPCDINYAENQSSMSCENEELEDQ